MPSLRTKFLATGACLCSGILAGVTANRALVELPAWQRLGAISWSNYVRAENHGATAVFYIVIGLLAILLTLLTALAFKLERSAGSLRKLPAYAAALLALLYAVITRAILVPALAKLNVAAVPLADIEQSFSIVLRWSGVNDLLHVLAFVLSLWALVEATALPKRPEANSGRS